MSDSEEDEDQGPKAKGRADMKEAQVIEKERETRCGDQRAPDESDTRGLLRPSAANHKAGNYAWTFIAAIHWRPPFVRMRTRAKVVFSRSWTVNSKRQSQE